MTRDYSSEKLERKNINEFLSRMANEGLVAMKDIDSNIKKGDVLSFGGGGIVADYIKGSSSYVYMEHSFGDEEYWESVGLDMNEKDYYAEIKSSGRKAIGEDEWQLCYIGYRLEKGIFKFTDNDRMNKKWLLQFIERIDDEDDDEDDDEE